MSLQGKTAILFGAGAIASGYAKLLAAEGMNIVLVSRGESAQALASSIEKIGEITVIANRADASDRDDVSRVFSDTFGRFGRLDLVVNGSGGHLPQAIASDVKGILKISSQAVHEVIEANYLSKWFSMQAYLEYLQAAKHTGSVVNITSMGGFVPLSKGIHYSAAFAAVENLTSSMAYVYAHYGVGRVNNVAVGFVCGEQNRRLLYEENGELTPRGKEIIAHTAQHRFLTPEDIAPHVVHLADEEKSGSINGATLRVDGGYTLVSLPQTGYI